MNKHINLITSTLAFYELCTTLPASEYNTIYSLLGDTPMGYVSNNLHRQTLIYPPYRLDQAPIVGPSGASGRWFDASLSQQGVT